MSYLIDMNNAALDLKKLDQIYTLFHLVLHSFIDLHLHLVLMERKTLIWKRIVLLDRVAAKVSGNNDYEVYLLH
jgi:hypothetical protein